MIKPPIESGMQFIFHNDEDFFPIEDWAKEQNLKKVRSVEYIYAKKKKILLIEAKSSSPRPKQSENNVEYETFINEIIEKVTHSIDMLFGTLAGFRDIQLPESYKKRKYLDRNIIVLLVINGHKAEWVLPIEKDLKDRLRGHISIWRMEIKVINDETAEELELIERR